MKSKIAITIDSDILSVLKLQNVSISPTVNEFLRNYIDTPNIKDKDEHELKNKIDDIEERMKKDSFELTNYRIQLQKIMEHKDRERKEYVEKGVAMVHAMNNAGIGR